MTADDPTRDMAPGDEAPPGTPGAGENICPACGGTGQLDGATCQTCAGTGVVIEEVGAPRTVRPSPANPVQTHSRRGQLPTSSTGPSMYRTGSRRHRRQSAACSPSCGQGSGHRPLTLATGS